MTVEQTIARFAADCYFADGQFLPVWFQSGDRVGGGDFPTAVSSKGAAKRIATNQCNRENAQWRGYVVERRGDKLIVFLVSEWNGSKHVGRKDCWRRGWHFDLNAEHISVTIQADAPRLRPSSLAERATGLIGRAQLAAAA